MHSLKNERDQIFFNLKPLVPQTFWSYWMATNSSFSHFKTNGCWFALRI